MCMIQILKYFVQEDNINILIYHPLHKGVEEDRPACGENGNRISTNPSEDGHPCGRKQQILGIDNEPRRNHSIS